MATNDFDFPCIKFPCDSRYLGQHVTNLIYYLPTKGKVMPTVMKELPVNNSISLRASALPEIYKDPADRFIIATALLNDLTVVTGDRRFSEYGVETIQ